MPRLDHCRQYLARSVESSGAVGPEALVELVGRNLQNAAHLERAGVVDQDFGGAVPPSPSMSCRISARLTSRRAIIATAKPSPAKRRATAAPSPGPTPSTAATLPFMGCSSLPWPRRCLMG